MYKGDYLLKLISEFAKALAKILKLYKGGDTESAIKNIDYAFKELLKLNFNEVLSKAEELSKKLEKEKIEMIAELLKIKGDIAYGNNEIHNAQILSLKSLEYFNIAEKLLNTYSAERQRKISGLEERIVILKRSNEIY